LAHGQGQYPLLFNERGGTIDDLYAYRLAEEAFFLIVNASRTQADVAWLRERASEISSRQDLQMTDASHNYAAVAIQGPRVREFIDGCISGGSSSCTRVQHVTDLKKNDIGGF